MRWQACGSVTGSAAAEEGSCSSQEAIQGHCFVWNIKIGVWSEYRIESQKLLRFLSWLRHLILSLLQLIERNGAGLDALQGAFSLHTVSHFNADIWYGIT